jgi:hypothetical protein
MSEQMNVVFDKLKNMDESTSIFALSVLNIIVILIAFMVYFYYTGSIFSKGLKERDCKLMTEIYGERNRYINNLSDDKIIDYTLKDFYIKTAYNACSGGNYKNDYVDTCVLTALIKQGVRCLDFEIFSINDEPVVATTTNESFCVKETFNYVPFGEVLNILQENAFTASISPNPNDPLIIHLRIKSTNTNMINNLTELLASFQKTNGRLLGPEFSYSKKNLSNIKFKDLIGKVIIIADGTNKVFIETLFDEYVNMLSSSSSMRSLRYNDIKYTPDMDELIRFNMLGMTIGLPDKGASPANPSSILMREYGCQMLALRYQSIDSNIEENNIFFDDAGYAFVLKPADLRYQKIVVRTNEQTKKVDFKERSITTVVPGLTLKF